jgi:hypothetical protein
MYKPHTQCRACGYAKPPYPGKSVPSGEKLKRVFSLGLQPLANDFCGPDDEQAGFAPLDVMLCPNCSLAQLSVVVDPEILYWKYNYITSQSQTMAAHFDSLWAALEAIQPSRNVIEIGSNDGYFLAYCGKNGAEYAFGVDPAANLCKIARERGVDTLCSVFNSAAAQAATSFVPGADLIVARHVFCHVDDWHQFIHDVASMCEKRTLVYIEVPYVLDLLKNTEFDTVYHEHTSYLSIKAMLALLRGGPLALHKILRFPIHGGAIGLVLRPGTESREEDVAEFLEEENQTPMEARWTDLSVSATGKRFELKIMVEEALEKGKRVVGYGASAKSTVWVNACGFTRRHIEFVCDSTPSKQYKFSPGTNIPIVDEGALTRELPDLAICFAWNYAPEIIAKEKHFRDHGGKWIIPHPNIRVL